jgi:hypothetical protein
MTIERRTKARHLVETSRALQATGWEVHRQLVCATAELGHGRRLGRAALSLRYGRRVPEEGGEEYLEPIPAIDGRYVRVLVPDSGGSITVDGYPGETWLAKWTGYVQEPELHPDGNAANPGGGATWEATEIRGLLDQLYVYRGHELSGSTLINPGTCPVFNDLAAGDCRTSDYTFRDVPAMQARIHDRTGSGEPWTAYKLLNYLLVAMTNPELPLHGEIFTGRWVLSAGGLLNWTVPRLELHGRTIAECFNLLCGQDRGLTWRTGSVSGDLVTIEVLSTAGRGTTIGTETAPTASKTAVDLDGDLWIERPVIRPQPAPYNGIFGWGGRPLVGITVHYTAGDGASAIIPDGFVESATPVDQAGSEHVWRKWKINPSWDCLTYDSTTSGLRANLEPGETLPDGDREYSAAHPPPGVLELSNTLPAGQGWTDDETGSRQEPVVVVGSVAAGWEVLKIAVRVEKGAILLGNSAKDAQRLKWLLADGSRTLLVTLGIYEWAPLYVADVDNPTFWARDMPTIFSIEAPKIRQTLMLAGAVKGVDGSRALVKYSSDTYVVNEVAALQRLVAQKYAALCSDTGSGHWSENGVLSDLYPPGEMINPLTAGGTAYQLNALVNRRIWHFVDYTTTWHLERMRGGAGCLA